MPDTPQLSGRDLARQALAAYKATARTQPTPAKKPRRTTRPARGEGRDPQGLGAIIGRLTDEQGWADSVTGGDLLDQWPTIAPAELATTVQAVSYDPDRGLLTLRPSTPAYATQIRLFQLALAKRLNTALGKLAVRSIRVLPPGATSAPGAADTTPTRPAPEAPVRTRETASPGYRTALELSLTHRPERTPTDPYLAEAIARQDQALRSRRLPEDEHADYRAEQERLERQAGPARGSSEASRQAALAFKRRQAAGLGEPRRAFDVA